MTCHSWYTITVPHLHHSLTTDESIHSSEDQKYLWPTPLKNSYNLGLLPLVKRFRIRGCAFPTKMFTLKWLDNRALCYLSALTNLQELGIDDLHLSSFMPDIQRYFGHFAPTLRLLSLWEPKGSCREILYFIGLFPNLQDLKLCYHHLKKENDGMVDSELVPLFVPPLGGRLILTCFTRDTLVKEMIAFFKGLRFRYMDLFRVTCTRLLLTACSETLEILRLYPTDNFGEYLFSGEAEGSELKSKFIANDRAVRSHLNLSRNKSLRTLEVSAASIAGAGEAASPFLKTVLSTIESPLPLEVVIIYREIDFGYDVLPRWEPLRVRYGGWCKGGPKPSLHSAELLEVLREMRQVRELRLVFCADVLECLERHALRKLERYVETESSRGGSDYLQEAPLIISEMRTLRSRPGRGHVGLDKKGAWMFASAL